MALESPSLFPQTPASVRSPQKYVSQKGEEAEGLQGPAVPLAGCGLRLHFPGVPRAIPGEVPGSSALGRLPRIQPVVRAWKGGLSASPCAQVTERPCCPVPSCSSASHPATAALPQPQLGVHPAPAARAAGSGCPSAAAPHGHCCRCPVSQRCPLCRCPPAAPRGSCSCRLAGGCVPGQLRGPRALDSPPAVISQN